MAVSGEVKVVRTGDPAADRTLDLIVRSLAGTEIPVVEVEVPGRDLPRRPGRETRRLWKSFSHTPTDLMEAWRVARHLERSTEPGDLVLVSDLRGTAGVFVLEQAMTPPERRRRVLVAAADGSFLEYQAIAGTHQGVDEGDVAAIDWELISYRFAEAVLATSRRAVEVLEGEGIEAHLVTEPDGAPDRAPRSGTPRVVWLPEHFSRRSQTPAILRGLLAVRDELPDLRVVVSGEDREDRIWSGTTWEAFSALRALFGEALVRGGRPEEADLVVLGDPHAVPSPEVEAARDEGLRVLMAEGSTAAALWPEAETWSGEDDLAEGVASAGRVGVDVTEGIDPFALRPPSWEGDRARRVSVGVPVFRDVAHLDECLGSILAQSQAPHEVILVDDGSRSEEVDRALERWRSAHPELVRTLRQPNRGVCVARNLALEHMTGDAFLLVDQDDQLHPEFLEACAEALRGNPGLWAVATWTEFFDDYRGVEAKPPFDRRVALRENPIISTCALVDMRVRDQGIRFTPDLAWIFCEDWDFWAQIVAAGGAFGLVPRALARHRVHHSSGGFRRTPLAYALGRARAAKRLGS